MECDLINWAFLRAFAKYYCFYGNIKWEDEQEREQ